MNFAMRTRSLLLVASASTALASEIISRQSTFGLESCPGYTASNVATTSNGLTADLKLAGAACNTYGQDLDNLKLSVQYETCKRSLSANCSQTRLIWNSDSTSCQDLRCGPECLSSPRVCSSKTELKPTIKLRQFSHQVQLFIQPILFLGDENRLE
jgi:hypothetical protein